MRRGLFAMTVIFIAVYSCVSIVSCGESAVYNQYQAIRGDAWESQDEYFFSFDITNSSAPYNIYVCIRNNDNYPYRNLWLLCEERRERPEGSEADSAIVKDTVECTLADDFGKWMGQGITLFKSQTVLRQKYHFPDTGRYTIGVRHGMRDEKLKGVKNVGLFVEMAE